ncbi:hypothetical protein ACIQ62_34125 [Streptomyces sp. NPDC096319]|uniref:hypothetical protein n=1 Tax=Streptomyces sp. NPDC096319 TaxID=3366084 RepID=UPI0037F468A3
MQRRRTPARDARPPEAREKKGCARRPGHGVDRAGAAPPAGFAPTAAAATVAARAGDPRAAAAYDRAGHALAAAIAGTSLSGELTAAG